jgi:hypothetical protein
MPTYQLAKYPHDYIGAIDDALRFLPRPVDYLFYTFRFYGLLVLKVDPLKALLAHWPLVSTHLIIILCITTPRRTQSPTCSSYRGVISVFSTSLYRDC